MKTHLLLTAAFLCLFALFVANGQGETPNCESSTTVIELIADDAECPDWPPLTGFLAPYVNPDQAKVPADGIYPMGQRMWLSAYSAFGSNFTKARDAGFTVMGPYFQGAMDDPYQWVNAESHGMKGTVHLRLAGGGGLTGAIELMKTPEGRESITEEITNAINKVQNNPKLNDYVQFWYSGVEEPMGIRNPIADERAYLKLSHDIVQRVDKRKRPLYVSERGDAYLSMMRGNQCGMQDGCLKQNYLINDNGYSSDGTDVRLLIWRWARDVIETAEYADDKCPSYTGKPRAAITTLSAYIDPKNPAERNEAWLRKTITYDVYVSLAAGIDGIAVYDYSGKHSTVNIQKNLYNELLGFISRSGLGKVFLWGDDRTDVKMEITQGPTEVKWKKYSKTYTAPSVFMRNIQYGVDRYILLVNNSKEVINLELSAFPGDLRYVDLITGTGGALGASITPTIQPLGVRMYKIAER